MPPWASGLHWALCGGVGVSQSREITDLRTHICGAGERRETDKQRAQGLLEDVQGAQSEKHERRTQVQIAEGNIRKVQDLFVQFKSLISSLASNACPSHLQYNSMQSHAICQRDAPDATGRRSSQMRPTSRSIRRSFSLDD